MRKYIKISAILVLFSSFAFSQQNNGTITGSVVDKGSGNPVEAADVTLHRVKDSTLVKGTSTDASGKFILTEIPPGRYYLKASLVGYSSAIAGGITITQSGTAVNLDPIKLSSSETSTEEIVVESEKPAVEFKPDKKVFNVTKDLTTQGGNLIDLLKNIPSVTVDQDGNVSLRGNQNVRILIDGKPFGLEGNGRNVILEQIPSNSVESIELVTNPSAKYEAEGSTGIINVVMKKNSNLGYNGTLGLNAGTGDKWSGQVNLSLKNDKVNAFGNYNYNLMNFGSSGTSDRTNFFSTDAYQINDISSGTIRRNANFIKLGADYIISPLNQIGLNLNFMKSKRTRNDNTTTTQYDPSGNLTSDYLTTLSNTEDNNTFDLGANFTHKFDDNSQKGNLKSRSKNQTGETPKHVLTGNFTYSYNKGDENQDNVTTYNSPSNTSPFKRKSFDKNLNQNFSGQLDYVHPFSNDSKLETGYKGTYKKKDDDYTLQSFDTVTNTYVTDNNFSNHFLYNEHVEALYGIYSSKIGDFSYSVGARTEGTFTNGDVLNTNQTFNRKYIDIFPSASATYKLSKTSDIQLTYSRRINRPRMGQLNPFIEINDPNNYQSGNPDLKPEYTDSYELSFIEFLPSISITPSLFYKHTKDEITRVQTLLDSVRVLSTFINASSSKNYGGEVMLNAQPFKFWSLNGTFSYFKRTIDAGTALGGLTNDGTSWTARAMTNITFPLDLGLQVSYFYSGKRITPQGTMDPMQSLDAALKKDLFDKKLSLTFRVSDLLNTQKFAMNLADPEFSQHSERRRDSRTFFLNVSYNFGNADKLDKQKKKENNDNQEEDLGY